MRPLTRPVLVRAFALALLVEGFASTAEAASSGSSSSSSKTEVPKLTVYRRARCEKANFGSADACDALQNWLDSWRIKYELRDVSRSPQFGINLSQRCLQKHISCSDSPIVDDGKNILTGTALANEMLRWANIVDPTRVDNEKSQKHDVVPEILAKDAPATPLSEKEKEAARPPPPKATEDDE